MPPSTFLHRPRLFLPQVRALEMHHSSKEWDPRAAAPLNPLAGIHQE